MLKFGAESFKYIGEINGFSSRSSQGASWVKYEGLVLGKGQTIEQQFLIAIVTHHKKIGTFDAQNAHFPMKCTCKNLPVVVYFLRLNPNKLLFVRELLNLRKNLMF